MLRSILRRLPLALKRIHRFLPAPRRYLSTTASTDTFKLPETKQLIENACKSIEKNRWKTFNDFFIKHTSHKEDIIHTQVAERSVIPVLRPDILVDVTPLIAKCHFTNEQLLQHMVRHANFLYTHNSFDLGGFTLCQAKAEIIRHNGWVERVGNINIGSHFSNPKASQLLNIYTYDLAHGEGELYRSLIGLISINDVFNGEESIRYNETKQLIRKACEACDPKNVDMLYNKFISQTSHKVHDTILDISQLLASNNIDFQMIIAEMNRLINKSHKPVLTSTGLINISHPEYIGLNVPIYKAILTVLARQLKLA